ncbi:MAG: radical SAM protein [Deltaproteobacteria bacterium]|nr:radical SAM protein [Deltaproteobacteria bacterium]
MIRTQYLRVASYIRLKRAKRKIAAAVRFGKAGLDFPPTSLNLMMADICNSQCIMCGHDYLSCGSSEMLTLKRMRTLCNHLDMKWVVDITYGGGGEPFLNPELSDITEFTRENYPVVRHMVISNFIAVREEMLRRMLINGVHFLVSINAATRETFHSVSGRDAFVAVMENLKLLVHLRHVLHAPVQILLSFVLMRQNIYELTDFVRLATDLGVDGVRMAYVRVYPESQRLRAGRSETIHPEDSLYYDQELSDRMVLAAEREALKRGISIEHDPLFTNAVQRPRECIHPWKSLYVNFNGDVYPCPASEILFRPKIDNRQYDSGNLLTQHYSAFWNNAFWQTLRRSNLKGAYPQVPECGCCGNAICWDGPITKSSHVLDWTQAERSALRL